MTFISYAQNFEDVMLWRALKHIHRGFYIDIGAGWPDEHSVTRAFYGCGWTGLNVEPNPELHRQLVAGRPRDKNLCLAASDHEGVQPMYIAALTGLSTLSDEIAAEHQRAGRSLDRQHVEVTTLAALWRNYVPPGTDVHFLKVDVEGLEGAVLRGNDWAGNRPWIVVVEAMLPLSQAESYAEWEPVLTAASYRFAYADGLNRFYVAGEREELLRAFQYPPNAFDDFLSCGQIKAEAEATDAENRALDAEFNSWRDQCQVAIYENSLSWRITRPLRLWKPVSRVNLVRRKGDKLLLTKPSPRLAPPAPPESVARILDFPWIERDVSPSPEAPQESDDYIPLMLDGVEVMFAKKSLNDSRGIGRVARELLSHLRRLQTGREAAEPANDCDKRVRAFFYAALQSCPELLPGNSFVLVHDVIPMIFPERFPLAFRTWTRCYQHIARQADVLVAVSHSAADDAARLLEIPRENIAVIHNGVVRLPVSTAVTPPLPPCPYVVYVGADDPHKNLDVVLRALKDPVLAGLAMVLIGLNYGCMARAREMGLAGRVQCLGSLDDRQTGYVISRAVAFVYPSLYEGFGLPPLEAGLLGIPSICSNRPAMTDVLADAALFADPESPREWATAIDMLHRDPGLRESLGNRARLRAQSFTWKDAAAKYVELFRTETRKTAGQDPRPSD